MIILIETLSSIRAGDKIAPNQNAALRKISSNDFSELSNRHSSPRYPARPFSLGKIPIKSMIKWQTSAYCPVQTSSRLSKRLPNIAGRIINAFWESFHDRGHAGRAPRHTHFIAAPFAKYPRERALGEMNVRCESVRRRLGSWWTSRSSKPVRPSISVWQVRFLSASANRCNPDDAAVVGDAR